jgi:hypothetical protein
MDVRLKSKIGPFSFKDTVREIKPSGAVSYVRREFAFNFDNDFRQEVPGDVWERIKDAFIDKRLGIKYSDAFKLI